MSGVLGVIDLSVWQLVLALGLVAVIAVVSARQSLGLERDLVIGSGSVCRSALWRRLRAGRGVRRRPLVLDRVDPRGDDRGGDAGGRLTAWEAAARGSVDRRGCLIGLDSGDARLRHRHRRPGPPLVGPAYIIPIAGMILGSSMTTLRSRRSASGRPSGSCR